ncbi:hypothetical protein NQZ68_003519, partial [Dissostichus eleginoides]
LLWGLLGSPSNKAFFAILRSVIIPIVGYRQADKSEESQSMGTGACHFGQRKSIRVHSSGLTPEISPRLTVATQA